MAVKHISPLAARKGYVLMLILALGCGLAFWATPDRQGALRLGLGAGCFVLFAGALAVKVALYRCPHCRRGLPNVGNIQGDVCPYCGAPLSGGGKNPGNKEDP